MIFDRISFILARRRRNFSLFCVRKMVFPLIFLLFFQKFRKSLIFFMTTKFFSLQMKKFDFFFISNEKNNTGAYYP